MNGINMSNLQCDSVWYRGSVCGECDPMLFYVSAIMPPVEKSQVSAGSKIKHVTQIPGRRKSQASQVNIKLTLCYCCK